MTSCISEEAEEVTGWRKFLCWQDNNCENCSSPEQVNTDWHKYASVKQFGIIWYKESQNSMFQHVIKAFQNLSKWSRVGKCQRAQTRQSAPVFPANRLPAAPCNRCKNGSSTCPPPGHDETQSDIKISPIYCSPEAFFSHRSSSQRFSLRRLRACESDGEIGFRQKSGLRITHFKHSSISTCC